MARYNNSYRLMHYTSTNVCDAVCTVDATTYNTAKKANMDSATFHGNGVVKTVKISNNYPLYKLIQSTYKVVTR